jgi:hypothetical protein
MEQTAKEALNSEEQSFSNVLLWAGPVMQLVTCSSLGYVV